MRSGLLLIAVLLLAAPSYGQAGVVPDTLDPRGYYPLAVGNAWEWTTRIFVSYSAFERHEITGDTTVAGRRYFIQSEYLAEADPVYGIDLKRSRRLLLRYDPVGARVVALAPAGGAEWGYTCDLSTPFGASASCGDGRGMRASGGFGVSPWDFVLIGTDTVRYRAVKHLYSLGGGDSFYHGLGRLPGLGDGATGSVDFVYVRVAGRAYGLSQMPTGTEDADAPDAAMTVYPNPARERLVVSGTGQGGTAVVYDALGREVRAVECGRSQPCDLDLTGLQRGTYFVQVDGGQGRSLVRSFVVR